MINILRYRKKADRQENYWKPAMALPRNWVSQGVLYMDKGERLYRLVTEILLTILLTLALRYFNNANWNMVTYILFSYVIVHSINWIVNCQFWCLVLHLKRGSQNRGMRETCQFYNDMAKRCRKYESIEAIAIYGSVSRRQWTRRSDVDIRFIRKKGFVNVVKACTCASIERFLAFIHRQPMDLYVADGIKWLATHMNSTEEPLILLKRGREIEMQYRDNPEVILDETHFSTQNNP